MKYASLIAVAIVATALASGIAVWSLSSNSSSPQTISSLTANSNSTQTSSRVYTNGNSTQSATSNLIPWQPPPTPPIVLVLHTPQYVEHTLNRTLVLPEPTLLGPSFRIIGVRIDGTPNIGASNRSQVAVTVYVWNGVFVNGSTTAEDVLNGKGVAIVESIIAPGGPDSAATAQSMIAPQQSCVVRNGVTSCTTDSTTNSDYIVTQNGMSIVVNPSGSQLTWIDPNRLVYVNIVGGSNSIQNVLILASSMTG